MKPVCASVPPVKLGLHGWYRNINITYVQTLASHHHTHQLCCCHQHVSCHLSHTELLILLIAINASPVQCSLICTTNYNSSARNENRLSKEFPKFQLLIRQSMIPQPCRGASSAGLIPQSVSLSLTFFLLFLCFLLIRPNKIIRLRQSGLEFWDKIVQFEQSTIKHFVSTSEMTPTFPC